MSALRYPVIPKMAALYSFLLRKQRNAKWTKELNDAVLKSSDEVAPLVREYANFLEDLPPDVKLMPTKDFLSARPDIGLRTAHARNIVFALVGNNAGVKGCLSSYGNVSPIGCVIDHLRIVGLHPLRPHLNPFLQRWVFFVHQ